MNATWRCPWDDCPRRLVVEVSRPPGGRVHGLCLGCGRGSDVGVDELSSAGQPERLAGRFE